MSEMNTNLIHSAVTKEIKHNIKKKLNPDILKTLHDAGITEFYIGGNSCNPGPAKDLDLFPVNPPKEEMDAFSHYEFDPDPFMFKGPDTPQKYYDRFYKLKRLAQTRNAYTIDINGTIIQLCNYYHPTVNSLVESFDFSHIQVGAKVKIYPLDPSEMGPKSIQIFPIYFTDRYLIARTTDSTRFRGSEYPLASMIRTTKYAAKSDHIHCLNDAIVCIIPSLVAMIKRGFKNYEDFKDQIDAIDLGLEDPRVVNDLYELYMLLTKNDGSDYPTE